MGFARPFQDKTCPIELTRTTTGIIGNPILSAPSQLDENSLFQPLDERLIVWYPKRPKTSNVDLKVGGYPISNAYITEYNKTLTRLLQCNTCVSLLGDAGSSKCALFYLIKYIFLLIL
jgi:hypothetical protein